jgi:hypothetical protein
VRRIRDDDERSDEFLAACGRESVRLGLAVAWTRGVVGEKAKQAASWKSAKPFAEAGHAAGFYVERARTRNPIHPVRASDLVGVEIDGDEAELRAKHGLPEFPETVRVLSRRGAHVYLRPPEGRSPMKVEIAERKVTRSEDGVLIGAGSLHPSGHVYCYNGRAEIAVCPVELYEALVRRAGETTEQFRDYLAEGGVIREGEAGRPGFIFHLALELAHDGLDGEEIFPLVAAINRRRCVPPLPDEEVRRQVRGAVVRARRKPRDPQVERLGREAERELEEWARELQEGLVRQDSAGGLGRPRAEDTPTDDETEKRRASRGRRDLFLPFERVELTGPPRFLWRGKIPRDAVTLLAGRPKLGKSLLVIWLAAQLSRGLLEGDYRDAPATTLLIAAEDPADVIVKPRLIAAAADEAFVGLLAVQDHQGHHESPRANGDGLDGLDREGSYARRLTVPDEYRLLEEIIVENDVTLLVLDPINSFISHKVDAHRDAEIRRVLDPLGAMAARRHFAALAVVHLNRRSDTDVLNRITGSGGYGGSARSILTFGRHPENEAQRIVAAEGNWQKQARSDLFEIREVVVFPEADPDDQTQPALVHVGTTDLDSADLIDQMNDDRSALEDAKDLLLGELAFGPVAVTDLKRAAEAYPVSWPTVERAKKILGVQARRISTVGGERGAGRWEWFLELKEEEPE